EDATATAPEADASPEVSDSQVDRRSRRRPADSLFIRFKRITCTARGLVQLRYRESWACDASELQAAMRGEIANAQRVVRDDPEHLRVNGSPADRVRVADDALISEQAFGDFTRTLTTDVVPQWAFSVAVSLRDATVGEPTVVFEFTNTSTEPADAP